MHKGATAVNQTSISTPTYHLNLFALTNYKLKRQVWVRLVTLWWTAAKGIAQGAVSPYARSTLNSMGNKSKDKSTLKANYGRTLPAKWGPESGGP